MREVNLGTLTGPVLLFGGPYGNLQATEALLDEAQSLQLSPKQLICNGDLVAYCAEPQSTVDLLRNRQVQIVQGNCEASLAQGSEDCGCGFEPGSSCSLLSAGWYRFCQNNLCAETLHWMGALPQALRFELAGRRFIVIHGGLSRNNRFLFESDAEHAFEQELALTDADVVIAGHCGVPFGRAIGSRSWLNTGVIGMPANDGTERGWYLLLEPGPDGIEGRWLPLDYQAAVARERMHDKGLTNGYADTLLSGRWPSTDVLPAQEQSRTGIPIKPTRLMIS